MCPWLHTEERAGKGCAYLLDARHRRRVRQRHDEGPDENLGLPRWSAVATRESACGPCALVASGGRPVLPCRRQAAWRPWLTALPGGLVPRPWGRHRGGGVACVREEASREWASRAGWEAASGARGRQKKKIHTDEQSYDTKFYHKGQRRTDDCRTKR